MATFTDPGSGLTYHLGNLEADRLRFGWPEVGAPDQPPLIPRAQWREVDLSDFVTSPGKDQDGQSACNAFATVNCLEACRRMAGLPAVRLSPGHLYGRINQGRDQGSYLEDALKVMTEQGVCTAATVPDLEWHPGRWPAQAAQEMASYRFLETWLVGNFDLAASALQRGCFLDLGIMWCKNFVPGAGGWLPARGQGQVGGHAICGCGLLQHPSGQGWGIKIKNSWTDQWGVQGFGVIPETAFGGPVGGWWALRSPVQEQTDIPTPTA